MAMSVGTASGATFCDINTTPLIDVMLVLLVTLIVTLPVMTHAVKLDMPNVTNPPPPPPPPPEGIDLELDFDRALVWSDKQAAGIAHPESDFDADRDETPQPLLHLTPDRRAG